MLPVSCWCSQGNPGARLRRPPYFARNWPFLMGSRSAEKPRASGLAAGRPRFPLLRRLLKVSFVRLDGSGRRMALPILICLLPLRPGYRSWHGPDITQCWRRFGSAAWHPSSQSTHEHAGFEERSGPCTFTASAKKLLHQMLRCASCSFESVRSSVRPLHWPCALGRTLADRQELHACKTMTLPHRF